MATSPDKTVGRFAITEDAKNNFDTALPQGIVSGQADFEGQYQIFDVEGDRWNKLYPYQLIVVEKKGDSYVEFDPSWKFTLPISPQSMEIDMPFAITTSATLGGVIEEHNAAPFRMINLSASTGVLPLKGAGDTVPDFNIARGIFAGTVNAVSTLITDLQSGGIIAQPTNVVDDTIFNDNDNSINRTSGYYQFHLLKQFFQSFTNYKKTQQGKNLRLTFNIWKDNTTYLVTPMMFKLTRSADSPYEYRFQLSLKAFAEISIGPGPQPDTTSILGRQPNKWAKMINALETARTVLQDAKKILQAGVQDVENAFFGPLREIVLAGKAVAGIGYTVADFPSNIISDCKENILELFGDEFSANTTTTPSRVLDKAAQDQINAIKNLSILASKSSTLTGQIAEAIAAMNGSHPANKLFANGEDNFSLFNSIDLGRLKLPPNVQRKIAAEKARVAAFTRIDYEIKRNGMVQVLVDFAESVGLGSETYNRIYQIQPRTATVTKTATDDDFDIIFNMNKVITEVNRLCVSNKVDPNHTSAGEFIAGLARRSGIAFNEPRSKFLVPFLYEHTIEQMAEVYLGDTNRWNEIATLNGLREPYVDEVGFDVFLSTNGKDNTVQVADVTNLFIGQFIHISSATVRSERRRITGIQRISPDTNYVTLDGDPTLDRFTIVSQAKIHAYLPDTVNSQMSIYIPSDADPHAEDFKSKTIPGIDYFDNLIRVGGISLLLTPKNDIAFAPDGSARLAVGLTNIVQKARLALSTVQGSLLQHPSYGLPVKVGESTADVSAKSVLKAIKDMFSHDPTFSKITSASVLKKGGTTQITVNIGIAGTTQVIPITADIRR